MKIHEIKTHLGNQKYTSVCGLKNLQRDQVTIMGIGLACLNCKRILNSRSN